MCGNPNAGGEERNVGEGVAMAGVKMVWEARKMATEELGGGGDGAFLRGLIDRWMDVCVDDFFSFVGV